MEIYGYNPRYEDISGGKYHMNIKKKLGILLIVIIAVRRTSGADRSPGADS